MKFLRIVMFALLLPGVQAQTPAPASIRGRVVTWGTSEPIAQAIVELRDATDTSGVPLISSATQPNGEYLFPRVPPGRYRIVATRKGYAPGEYGRKRLSGAGTPVALVPGQAMVNAQIAIARGATISGRVSYPNGDPMPVVGVQVSKVSFRNGRPELTLQQSTYTNDLGEYRLFWIPPGSYYVSAENAQNNMTPQLLINPGGNSTYSWSGVFGASRPSARILRDFGIEEGQTYVRIYYPGTPSLENAAVLDLHAGDEATNINLTLTPVLERRLRGQVVDANGQPVQGTIVVSVRQLDASLPSATRTLQFFPDNGRFQFLVTQTGTYELRATVGPLAGRVTTVLRDREAEVSIPLFPATALQGKVRFESTGAAGAGAPGVTVTLRGPGGQFSSPVAANGDFAFQNLPVSGYQVEIAMPGLPDAYLKSMQIDNVDALNQELSIDGFPKGQLQIVVSPTGGSIEGRVLDARQQPAIDATVAVLPEGLPPFTADRYRSASIDSSGMFRFRGLPPGDYNVYAWEDVDSGAWFNPAFLRNYDGYRRSIRITEGRKETADIVAAPVTP